MRRVAQWVSACAAAVAFASACGGAADSPLLAGDGGGADDGGSEGAAPDGAGCDTSKCPSVPAGFDLVRVGDGKAGCPAGWQTTPIVTNPTAADGTCTCACDVTAQPSCDTGDITRAYDDLGTPTCNVGGVTLPANQGGCTQTGQALFLGHAHYEVDPPAATGGACSLTATLDKGKLSASPASLCQPPSSCAADACDGNVCVAQAGDVDCPDGFAHKTLVGTAATADCSDCGACSLAATCTGTMSFYSDTQCMDGETDFPADGVCQAASGSTTSYYYSYSYTGSVASATCADATSTATPGLDGKKTVCCQQ